MVVKRNLIPGHELLLQQKEDYKKYTQARQRNKKGGLKWY